MARNARAYVPLQNREMNWFFLLFLFFCFPFGKERPAFTSKKTPGITRSQESREHSGRPIPIILSYTVSRSLRLPWRGNITVQYISSVGTHGHRQCGLW